MTDLRLTPELLSDIAGWEAVKAGRRLLDAQAVRESSWTPPRLQGLVQDGGVTFRAGLILRNRVDVDNLCTCRRSRVEGIICGHSVAVGLHWIASQTPASAPKSTPQPTAPAKPPAGPASSGASLRQPAAEGPAGSSPSPPSRWRRTSPGEPAEPARLHVILPPDLGAALQRGRVMFVFEVEWKGRRRPLTALPDDAAFAFPAEDQPVLELAEAIAQGDIPALLQVPAAEASQLFSALAGHPRVTSGRRNSVTILRHPAVLRLRADLEPTGEITLKLDGTPPPILETAERPWAWLGQTLQPLALPAGSNRLLRGPVRLSRDQVPAFLSLDWPAWQANEALIASFSLEDFVLDSAPPRIELALTGTLRHLEARLAFRYGNHRINPTPARENAAASLAIPDAKDPLRYQLRDLPSEQAALARLQRSGFRPSTDPTRLELEGETTILNFFAREFPRLEAEWDVRVDAGLDRVSVQRIERIAPVFRFTPSGEQWFDFSVSFQASTGEQLSPADIHRLLRAGQSHTQLRNGRTSVIDTGALEELEAVLRDCDPQQQGQAYRLPQAHAAFLTATLEAQPAARIEAPAAWLDRARAVRDPSHEACPPLGPLEAVLRPYQKQGVAWMWFLRQRGFGGILADEMGLGKTLQTLAYLHAARRASPGPAPAPAVASPQPPALIVCPTSLVFNWLDEAARFTPWLRFLGIQGPAREALRSQIHDADVVVTSYALLRRDVEDYRGQSFDTVILDEAQHIKNRQTQNAQAVKSIRAAHRLVLTGTPLENSILDLWSIFDFLMPGYLGTAADFRERYEIPVTRDRDPTVQTRLARRVRPFVLRRLKREVLPELPPRLEQVAFCDLTPEQSAVYRQIMEAGRREWLHTVEQHGLAKSRTLIFTTLLRLRQVCCDLRLLDIPELPSAPGSGKMELFEELLEQIRDGGHRALVFSQFTRMLALLRARLDQVGTEYCYLDGSTTDRAAVVRRFQATPSIPFFLISLKAGGTGLNLTGADTVILFDPWWNPAVETQAADRTHRIGQTRRVTTYRLVARGTVEEKILHLQTRKKELLNTTLGAEEDLAQALTWDEIQGLLT